MGIFFRFISSIYLKNFFIICFALTFFFVGIDLLLNYKDLPQSANLDLLYIMFLSFSAISYILPISLVFALILTLISLIRTNEFVSFYSLSISKNLVILYPFLWALFFCFVYVGLNTTSFAYANDYKKNISKNGVLEKTSSDIFLKYNDKFVYVFRLDPSTNIAQDVKMFNIKDLNLTQIISAKNAYFEDDHWVFKDGKIINIPNSYDINSKGFEQSCFDDIKTLYNFKPKALESVNNENSYSIIDAFESLKVFSKQNINTTFLKIELYKLAFAPFFAPFLMLGMYYFFPVISRFFNLAFVSFVFFTCILIVWGFLFLLIRLSENGVLNPELGIIFPVLAIMFFSIYMFIKNK